MTLNRLNRILGIISLSACFGFALEGVASTGADPGLMEAADIVVTGMVTEVIMERIPPPTDGRSGGGVTNYVATVKLSSAEKGRLGTVKAGESLTLTVRWSNNASAGVVFPDAQKGDRCRFYLEKGEKENVWKPLYTRIRQGIEILEKTPKPQGEAAVPNGAR